MTSPSVTGPLTHRGSCPRMYCPARLRMLNTGRSERRLPGVADLILRTWKFTASPFVVNRMLRVLMCRSLFYRFCSAARASENMNVDSLLGSERAGRKIQQGLLAESTSWCSVKAFPFIHETNCLYCLVSLQIQQCRLTVLRSCGRRFLLSKSCSAEKSTASRNSNACLNEASKFSAMSRVRLFLTTMRNMV